MTRPHDYYSHGWTMTREVEESDRLTCCWLLQRLLFGLHHHHHFLRSQGRTEGAHCQVERQMGNSTLATDLVVSLRGSQTSGGLIFPLPLTCRSARTSVSRVLLHPSHSHWPCPLQSLTEGCMCMCVCACACPCVCNHLARLIGEQQDCLIVVLEANGDK